ncbi:craniofacial development protein 2-like [Melitaea cinxia]|uniref:craniofacial development protein 2-like n=1 Tax=Melitaea cinxia TaxID=113334 RepID=UPI001E2748AC|nr:craniofacial development protein 2-like [Melitaea cinxia]
MEKLQELELALDEIKWDIIGISEVRRFGERIEDHEKYVLHHIEETPGLYGVGFIVKKDLAKNILELRGISERIAFFNIQLSVDGEEEQLWSITQAYSPTESNRREDILKIEKFYEDLQSTAANTSKNIKFMGDFSGQIGKQKSGEEYTIGNHGFGNRSKNGSRLVSFAIENKFSILNSFYKKKPSKKWTWISPNGQYKNEIDYVMSNNAKVFKELSISSNFNFKSDHRMVRAKLSSTHAKRARKLNNSMKVFECTGSTDLLLNNLKISLHDGEKECIST